MNHLLGARCKINSVLIASAFAIAVASQIGLPTIGANGFLLVCATAIIIFISFCYLPPSKSTVIPYMGGAFISIAYCLKLTYIHAFNDTLFTLEPNAHSALEKSDLVNRAVTCNCIAAVSLSTWIWLRFLIIPSSQVSECKKNKPESRQGLSGAKHTHELAYLVLLIFGIALSVILLVARSVFQLAIAHQETVRLPFGLSGAIVYSMDYLCPLIFLLCISMAIVALNSRCKAIIAALALLALAVSSGIIAGNRGPIVTYFALPLIVLCVLCYGISIRSILWILPSCLIIAILHPVFTSLRDIETKNLFVFIEILSTLDVSSALSLGIQSILMRAIGADGLILCVQPGSFLFTDPSTFCNVFLDPTRDITSAFTEDFAYSDANGLHGAAMSLIGAFYLMGGYVGISLFVLIYFELSSRIYLVICRANNVIISLPTSAFSIVFFAALTSEGMLFTMINRIVVFLFSVLIVRYLFVVLTNEKIHLRVNSVKIVAWQNSTYANHLQ